jgi:hypothetical protein
LVCCEWRLSFNGVYLMPYYPPPVTGGGGSGQMTAAQIRNVLTAEAPIYPTPPIVTNWADIGVRPEKMTANVVEPVADSSIGSVSVARATDTTNAINAAFATGEKVVLGDASKGPLGTYVVNGTIRPSGTNSEHAFGQRRQVEFQNIGLRVLAAAPDEDFCEVLGMDRTKGRAISDVTISIANPAVVTVPAASNYKFFVGQGLSFQTTGSLPGGLVIGNSAAEAGAGAGSWNDGTRSADVSTVYFVSSSNYNVNGRIFRIAKTRANALAGTNSVVTTGTQSGVHSIHYGSIVGRVASDTFPVPTAPVRCLLDLGNTRYSHYDGNLRLHGANKANMALISTTGMLTLETFAGGGQSVWNGSINLREAGYGIYIVSRLDTVENLFLPDTMTGAALDNVSFEPSIDMPMCVGGNSFDGATIRRLRIASQPGSRSYVVNTHFSADSMFMHNDDGNTYSFQTEKASILAGEVYLEGGDSTAPNGGNFAAFVRQMNSCSNRFEMIKCSAGPSTFRLGVVDFVGINGSCDLGFQENSEESDMNVAILLTRGGGTYTRRCMVEWGFSESATKRPYQMSAVGATSDQLLSRTATTALAQWKPQAGSVTPAKTALTT